MNKAKLLKMAPAALTMVACLGVIATAITSARAALRARDILEVLPEDTPKKEKVKVVIKEAALPTAVAAGTIGSFIFVRTIDKRVIASLGAGVAALSTNVNESMRHPDRFDEPDLYKEKPDVIIDEDGDIYYESIGDIFIKIRPENMERALYKINRNYAIRGGLASIYELYRMIGLTKKQVKDLGLEWTEFIGYSGEWAMDFGYEYWIDIYTQWHNDDKRFKDICLVYPPMPLCCDPPRYVKDICGTETEDLIERGLYDKAEDVTDYIKTTIRDDDAD